MLTNSLLTIIHQLIQHRKDVNICRGNDMIFNNRSAFGAAFYSS